MIAPARQTGGAVVGRGFVFGGPAHSARGPDGVLHDAWPTTARLPRARMQLTHEAVPGIVDQIPRGDAWLIVRERVAGPSLRRIVEETVRQGARLEPAWALALLLPIADLLATLHGDGRRGRLMARVGPDAVIVDVDGVPRFVGFEHWAPVLPLQPSSARTAFTVPHDDSYALTATLLTLLSTRTPTVEREELAGLADRVAHIDDAGLREGLVLLCAKNLQVQTTLRQTTSECLASLEALQRGAPPVSTATLAALVEGLFPDEVQAERRRREEP